MIGFLQGEILFSDGSELILVTSNGIGHQVFCSHVLEEGAQSSLYITHIVRETSETLFGFRSLREKKLFELLIQVKGVGPKSAYALIESIGTNQVIDAIAMDSKKVLTKAPGVGPKAAAQIILDLAKKIQKFKMYTDAHLKVRTKTSVYSNQEEVIEEMPSQSFDSSLIQDAVMACKELGFKEELVTDIAQKILGNVSVSKPEQLVHLVLKEI